MDKFQIIPADKIKYYPLLILSNVSPETAHQIFEFTNTELNFAVNENLKEVDIAFDGFFIEIANYFGFKSDKTSQKLLDEKAYGLLHKCFSDPENKKAILVDYVNGWAKLGQAEDIYPKNQLRNPDHMYFTGYW